MTPASAQTPAAAGALISLTDKPVPLTDKAGNRRYSRREQSGSGPKEQGEGGGAAGGVERGGVSRSGGG